jgi:FkbM family methyltransferase
MANPTTDAVSFDLPHGHGANPVRIAARAGRDQVASIIARAGWEAYERPLPAVLYRTAAATPGLIADIGANTGFYAILAACAQPANRVLAFEPVPDILAALDENIRANGLSRRVRLIRCAIGARNRTTKLYMPLQDHGLVETSASLRADFKPPHSAALEVLERTLDRVLARPSLAFRRLGIIKIDVEGHECAVLEGAHWAITLHRPVIFIEVLPGANLPALNAFLARYKYADIVLHAFAPPAVHDRVDFVAESWNHAFVPRERVGAFLALHA